MSRFSDDWLALRESADHEARDDKLLEYLMLWLKRRGVCLDPASRPCRVIDLGTGTASNLRYLHPHLGPSQHWTLVDNDRELLTRLSTRLRGWATAQGLRVAGDDKQLQLRGRPPGSELDLAVMDLAHAWPDFSHGDLVTASALLDLFPATRIDSLAEAVVDSGAACLFALSYNGNITCHPEHDYDARLMDLINAHQLRDKGLGANRESALGPDGGDAIATALRQRGYRVYARPSDWQLGRGSAALQARLMQGWCSAALEQSPADRSRIKAWQLARERQSQDGHLHLQVGHVDVLGLPAVVQG